MSIIDKIKQQLSNSTVEEISSRLDLSTKADEQKENLKDKLNEAKLEEIVETSSSKPDLSTKADELRDRLRDMIDESKLEEIPTSSRPDLSTKADELRDRLKDMIDESKLEEVPTSSKPDLSTKADELRDRLKDMIDESKLEEIPTSSKPDLSTKLDELRDRLRDLIDESNLEEVPTSSRPDLSTKLDELREKLSDMISEIDELIEVDNRPGLGKPREDYILLDTFQVRFEKENYLINPEQVFAVTKPSFDVINSQETNEIKVTFTKVDAKHFFGRPSQFTNFKSDQEIIDLAKTFNEDSPEWIELIEFGDNSGIPQLSTRYMDPKITKIEFSDFSTQVDGVMKYYTATIVYDRKLTEKGEFEEIED